MHVEAGDFESAVPLLREALRLKEGYLGPDDGDISNGLNSLGFTLMRMGRYSEAEPLLRQAVEKCERNVGPDHQSSAMVLGSLGELLRRSGKTEEARGILERAVRIAERPNADGVVNTWAATDAHQSLGNLYADLGLRALADEHFRRAIAGSEKIDKRIGLADCLDDYASFLGRTGRVSEAAEIRDRANRIRISLPAPASSRYP